MNSTISTYNKVKKGLLPLSMLYGGVVWIRNKLFDWKILPSEEFPVPVICVGNITVGGTGKTPHVEYLIQLLEQKYKIAVLSRGYKRKTSGFILADEKATDQTIGDEPLQILKKFPETIVAVDGNRKRGIKNLLNLPDKKPDIILLDDAFQHRYVKPSCSILLTDSHRLIYEDALLPAGRLRESCAGKNRANMVIVTKCPPDLKPIDYRVISKHLNLFPYQDLFFTSFKYGNLTPCFETGQSNMKSLADIKTNKCSVLLVAGIANPQGLISELKMYTPHLETIIFPDHHTFSKNDIEKIESKFEQMHHTPRPPKGGVESSELVHSADPKSPLGDIGVIIITTEKDYIRLSGCEYITQNVKKALYYLPVKVVFPKNKENLFTQKIYDHVRKFKRNSEMAQATNSARH
ncbi:MAG: tetraacyldisaccharide 4'-kinase [Candidatus Azobacteroides sp.]|nr:tetraacyldisaccharide 4'-kinase [Candidatus Azobacteroides sp.]